MAEGGDSQEYNEVVEKFRNAKVNQQDKNNLEATFVESTKNVTSIWNTVEGLPEYIESEIHQMNECEAKVANEINRLKEQLDEVRINNKKRDEYHAAYLAAQEKKHEAKVAQLKAIRNEIDQQGNVLKQKKAAHAGHLEQLKTESGEVAKRTQVLKRLRSTLESKKLEFSKEQENLKSSSAKLDKVFTDRQKEIKELGDMISTKTDQLEAVKASNVTKTAELIETRSKYESDRAIAERKAQENLKMKTEFEILAKKRKDEIARLEGQLAEQRARYNDIKRTYTDLTDRLTSEFGNSKSPQEMTIEARTECQALELKRATLNETIDTICKSMQLNESKLTQLNTAKEDVLRRLRVSEQLARQSIANQSIETRRERSRKGKSASTERSTEKEQLVFRMPQEKPKKTKQRQKRKQQEIVPDVPEDQGKGVVRIADSSVVDFDTTTVESQSVVGVTNQKTDDCTRLAMFGEHFLGMTK